MDKRIKNKFLSALVYMLLVLACLQFSAWVSHMAFDNTCIDLQEQYIREQVGELVDTIENAVNFGKELDNYYGMEDIFSGVCSISKGNMEAALLDGDANPMYVSFENNPDNVEILSQLLGKKYREAVIKAAAGGVSGEKVELGDYDSMVFPIGKGEETAGYFLVIYKEKDFLEKNAYPSLEKARWIIWGCVSVCLLGFVLFRKEGGVEKGKGYLRYVPVLLVMSAILANMLFMYGAYKENYTVLVKRNAASSAENMKASIEELLQKGLSVKHIGRVSGYWNQKAERNDAIESISVVKKYFATRQVTAAEDSSVLSFELDGKTAALEVVVSQSYIQKQLNTMALIFGAVFVVCLMITYELIHFADVTAVRMGCDAKGKSGRPPESMGLQIKLLSFLCYGAIYTSMSYTAVIMRGWGARVFGLSQAVSASLPLTVELLCMMLCQVAAGKAFRDMKRKRLLVLVFSFLVLGNFACMFALSPYVLVCLRAFCGMGFGFLKYWLNVIVSSASGDSGEMDRNYAQLNAGLLGGITVGAALGSILAQAMGYLFNYFFTGALCVVTALFSLCILPFSLLDSQRGTEAHNQQMPDMGLSSIFKNRVARKAILLGDIPLNVGLMYVVAFLPVYMDTVGQLAIATSYAYLINGLTGAYLGIGILRLLRRISAGTRAGIALLMGAAGILVLTTGSSIWILLLSAGIMGLFDGYGTPVITGFFTSLPQVRGSDAANMLTVFNSIGSAVQVLCPMFYNMLILPDGNTRYLTLFGGCYLGIAVLFLLTFGRRAVMAQKEGVLEDEIH